MTAEPSERIEPAGEKQRFRIADDGSATMYFDDKGTGRQCGACQLCCKLMPVPQLGKGASTRCRHAKAGKGCGIYADRPDACRWFACGWLADEDAGGLPRPDRAHYVVDLAPDHVTVKFPDGSGQRIAAIQIWCDPAFPTAHRDPALRAYLSRITDRFQAVAIVRFNSKDAVVLMPPSLTGKRDWVEQADGLQMEVRA